MLWTLVLLWISVSMRMVHISEMSKSFVNHPSQVVSVGDLVTVWVSKVDLEHEKLNLSLVNPRESN